MNKDGLQIKCDLCNEQLVCMGGLLFSPPAPITNIVHKYHICVKCYAKLSMKYKLKNLLFAPN
jgi:hypothetical protein